MHLVLQRTHYRYTSSVVVPVRSEAEEFEPHPPHERDLVCLADGASVPDTADSPGR